MRYDEFLQEQQKLIPSLNVSRETFDRLKAYVNLLEECNQKLNLVGSSEMATIWDRHVFDSMQLMPYIPKSSLSVCDVGSGAGFPGIVLGILGVSDMVLVESIAKKALFLENVSRETLIKNTILCDRVENLKKTFTAITARAVAPLKDLLRLTKNIRTSDTVCIFPKGKKYQEEIEDARRFFSFDVEAHQSLMHEEGRILVITHVC
jgi:16S rRNA (guanine527-N7)-methyltransferase